MHEETFRKLEVKDATEILELVNPALEGVQFDPALVTVLAQDLSFYPGHILYDIADYSTSPALRRFAVVNDKNVIILDWTNGPIYALNGSAPLSLNDDNIDDYVRFFFSYSRGNKGAFMLAENIDDVRWRDDPPPAARKAIGNLLMPLAVIDQEKNGAYRLQTSMVFKNTLFQSDIEVGKDGQVSLSNEELLLEDLPVLDDIFGQ